MPAGRARGDDHVVSDVGLLGDINHRDLKTFQVFQGRDSVAAFKSTLSESACMGCVLLLLCACILSSFSRITPAGEYIL